MPLIQNENIGFPCLEINQINDILTATFNIHKIVSSKFLYSCQDQNIKLEAQLSVNSPTKFYFVKIVNLYLYDDSFENERLVHVCLDKFLNFLSEGDQKVVVVQKTIASKVVENIPVTIITQDGNITDPKQIKNLPCLIKLAEWLPGNDIGQLGIMPDNENFNEIGHMTRMLHNKAREFASLDEHLSAEPNYLKAVEPRKIEWDMEDWYLAEAENVEKVLKDDQEIGLLIKKTMSEFEQGVKILRNAQAENADFSGFQKIIVHHDLNTENVLAEKNDTTCKITIKGIIDYLDLVFRPAIYDLAILISYWINDTAMPQYNLSDEKTKQLMIDQTKSILKGYDFESMGGDFKFTLEKLLLPAVKARMCQSICKSYEMLALHPEYAEKTRKDMLVRKRTVRILSDLDVYDFI